MSAAQQTSGRLSMQRLGLNICSWQAPQGECLRLLRTGSSAADLAVRSVSGSLPAAGPGSPAAGPGSAGAWSAIE